MKNNLRAIAPMFIIASLLLMSAGCGFWDMQLMKENQELRNQISNLENEIAALKQQLPVIERLKKENQELEKKIAETKEQIAKLKAQLGGTGSSGGGSVGFIFGDVTLVDQR